MGLNMPVSDILQGTVRPLLLVSRWLTLCVLICGCASTPSHVRFYEGEARLPNDVATIQMGEGVHALKCGDTKLTSGKVGELLPGTYEITVEGWWWDRSNEATNAMRGALAATCFVGVYGSLVLFPLAVTCLALKPDKNCDCNASLSVSAGNTYKVFVDWSGTPPMLYVSESDGNTTVVTGECLVRE